MRARCVSRLFELQAERTPDRVALAGASERLTYAEADRRANQVARRLRGLGAGPDTLVGLYTRRPGAMLGMLGILKAEAAYVPLDPSYPPLRIRQMLQSARPKLLLTESGMPDLRAAGALDEACTTVCLGADTDDEPTSPPPGREDRADTLAYVMYTSGSTGEPKGVAMQHDALMNMLRWHRRARPESPQRRTLQFCATGFDFSFHEIFSTLCFGGSLVVAPEDIRSNPVALLDFICREDIERLFLPVSVLRQVAEVAGAGPVPRRLGEVITTGERLRIDPAMVRFFRDTGATLHNHYGATEFQDALTLTLSGDPAGWPELAPVGRAIDNVRTFILDEQYRQQEPGIAGELYIAGAGLARGYYGQAALTEQRFAVHAVRAADGRSAEEIRLYRTGDVARLRADGAVEILGRADEQTKINGVRVEPAEIEAVLAGHPAVKAVAVVAREDLPGQQRLVAYCVASGEARGLGEQLRAFLAPRLPAHLIPCEFVALGELPLTSSGKLDRRALAQRRGDGPTASGKGAARSLRDIERQVLLLWRGALKSDRLGVDDNFFDVGGTSLLAAQIHTELHAAFGAAVTSTTLFQHPTIGRLAAHLASAGSATGVPPATPDRAASSSGRGDDIAVIGMACRFPGADSCAAFWHNLINGIESITQFSDEELEQHASALRDHPDYVKVGFVLPDVASFDEEFFGYTARDAALIDPQQRILLECAWEAFEDAGYAPGSGSGPVGVFVGSSLSTYLINHVAPELGFGAAHPFIEADLQQFQLKMGNDRNYLATRISYKLDLTGPSLNVQTACSTSLVAVHLARRSILAGECSMALAGGISLTVPQRGGYLYQEGMVRSPDGHCRAFDADARGTLLGNGGGVVLLKRLADAERDGDNILAVLCGSAALNDGARKAGYAAPSVEGQAATIAAAIREAGIDSGSIAYVEAHGTATALGDPVEVAGLTLAFQATRREPSTGRCALGSVKTNIGHLDEAAGIAGIIKAAMVVRSGVIPASLYYNAPNPRIDFAVGPFYVNTTLSDWPVSATPRYVGVSAMGVGGTNCHVVLREPPAPASGARDGDSGGPRLLAISARTPAALRELAGRYVQHLIDHPALALQDIGYTAGVGRRHFAHRLAVRAGSVAELREQLEAFCGSSPTAGGQFVEATATATAGYCAGASTDLQAGSRVAFLFPGLGTAYAGMGRELYATQPVFRAELDRCEQLLADTGLLPLRLTEVLFASAETSRLGEIEYAQPILFAFEYALARLLQSWGLRPDLVVGHSAGEYAAACIAGVFSIEDGIRLTALRGRAMREHPNDGAMLEVTASADAARGWIAAYDELYIGVSNAPDSVVIAGRRGQVDEIQRELGDRGVRARRLDVPGAGHTPLQDPMADAFAAAITAANITLSPPGAAPILLSNLTGRRGDEADPRSPGMHTPRYWAEHSRSTVDFAGNMQALAREDIGLVVEVGPRAVLTGLGRRCLPQHAGLWTPTLQPGSPAKQAGNRPVLAEQDQLMACLARLYVRGAAVDWTGVHAADRARRVSLPTYPWQRRRHWFEGQRPQAAARTESHADTLHPLLGREVELAGSDEIRFQSRVSASWPRWMPDHRAFGALVMPGVGYIEMALAAGAEVLGGESLVLSDLLIQQSMILADSGDETVVQQVLRPKNDGSYHFEIHSALCTAGRRPDEWTLNATGELSGRSEPRAAARAHDIDALLAAHPLRVSLQQLKQQEEAVGVSLGPTFWIFEEIWLDRDSRSGFGRVRLTNSSAETPRELKQYKVHPAYLEACLLALTATYPERLRGKGYAPFFIESLRFAAGVAYDAGPATELWYHVRLRPVREDDDVPAFLTGDCTIFTKDGVAIVEIAGFQLTAANSQAMLRTASVPYHDWLYATQWRPLEVAAKPVHAAPVSLGPWVVWGGEDDLAETLATHIRGRGDACIVVRAGSRFEPQGDDGYSVDARDPDDYRRLAAKLSGAANILFVQGGPTDDPRVGDDCSRLMWLAQALLAGHSSANGRRLWLVTRDAYAGLGTGRTTAPGRVTPPVGAALAGMGGVITVEHPELRCAQIDTDADAPVDKLAAQIVEHIVRMQAAQLEDRVALRGDTWLTARLARLIIKEVLSPDRRVAHARLVAPDRSYLITGGLGGLGLLVAEWLVERGARHIVLVGRGAPTARAQEAIRTLEGKLSSLLVVRADVSRRDEVEALFERVRTTAPPLAGVVHAAGVARDGWFRELGEQQLTDVCAPKIDGSWNLHRCTADLQLDWFVLFSSASALLANSGQAGYAAANAFMDALAAQRRSIGLPALSVDWGTWSGVGLAADRDLDLWSRQSGEGTLSPPQGLRALERLLAAAAAGASLPGAVAVMPVRWPEFLNKRTSPSPYFAEFLASAPPRLAASHASPLHALASAPAGERRTLLVAHVQEQLAQVLGLPAAGQVPLDERLVDLGLDSLMIVELRNRLQVSLSCALPFSFLFAHPDVGALADQLHAQLFASDGAARGPAGAPSTVVGVQPLGTKPPLFFVSGVLGSVLDQTPLAQALGNDQPLLGLRSLGLDEDATPHHDLGEIAAHHVRSLRAVQPLGPYRVGGHSFGGVVAFEVARQLVAAGECVALLAIVDSAGPRARGDTSPAAKDEQQITAEFLAVVAGATGQPSPLSLDALAELTGEARLARIHEALQAMGYASTPADTRRMLAVHRANHLALAGHSVDDRMDAPTVLLRASTAHPEIEGAGTDEPTAGWGRLIAGPLTVVSVPGDHFTVMRPPGVGVLATQLAAQLAGSSHPIGGLDPRSQQRQGAQHADLGTV